MRVGKFLMAGLYMVAGVGHFVAPRLYENIMPSYIPAHHAWVLFTGVAEIAGGVGLLIPHTQRAAAWGLVLLLIAVSPVHIWMLQHPELYPTVPVWALWVRLPLQLVLIWWALQYTHERKAIAT